MTIKTFIERAIEGGWLPYWHEPFRSSTTDIKGYFFDVIPAEQRVDSMLLDPLAWQAVGKVEGWYCTYHKDHDERLRSHTKNDCADWKVRMLSMIEALIEGKTIEQYLETL